VDDLEQAILRVNLVGTAVKSALIARDLHRAHVQIREEVEHIAAIQRALLPHPIPEIPGLSIAASYQTSTRPGATTTTSARCAAPATDRRPTPRVRGAS
jgi:serine phosphatase RsbU (regulator of sigma subunit)